MKILDSFVGGCLLRLYSCLERASSPIVLGTSYAKSYTNLFQNSRFETVFIFLQLCERARARALRRAAALPWKYSFALLMQDAGGGAVEGEPAKIFFDPSEFEKLKYLSSDVAAKFNGKLDKSTADDYLVIGSALRAFEGWEEGKISPVDPAVEDGGAIRVILVRGKGPDHEDRKVVFIFTHTPFVSIGRNVPASFERQQMSARKVGSYIACQGHVGVSVGNIFVYANNKAVEDETCFDALKIDKDFIDQYLSSEEAPSKDNLCYYASFISQQHKGAPFFAMEPFCASKMFQQNEVHEFMKVLSVDGLDKLNKYGDQFMHTASLEQAAAFNAMKSMWREENGLKQIDLSNIPKFKEKADLILFEANFKTFEKYFKTATSNFKSTPLVGETSMWHWLYFNKPIGSSPGVWATEAQEKHKQKLVKVFPQMGLNVKKKGAVDFDAMNFEKIKTPPQVSKFVQPRDNASVMYRAKTSLSAIKKILEDEQVELPELMKGDKATAANIEFNSLLLHFHEFATAGWATGPSRKAVGIVTEGMEMMAKGEVLDENQVKAWKATFPNAFPSPDEGDNGAVEGGDSELDSKQLAKEQTKLTKERAKLDKDQDKLSKGQVKLAKEKETFEGEKKAFEDEKNAFEKDKKAFEKAQIQLGKDQVQLAKDQVKLSKAQENLTKEKKAFEEEKAALEEEKGGKESVESASDKKNDKKKSDKKKKKKKKKKKHNKKKRGSSSSSSSGSSGSSSSSSSSSSDSSCSDSEDSAPGSKKAPKHAALMEMMASIQGQLEQLKNPEAGSSSEQSQLLAGSKRPLDEKAEKKHKKDKKNKKHKKNK